MPLFVIVGLCLAIVALAAHGASILSPTATVRSYPSWMSGPLGGLWPWGVPRLHRLEGLASWGLIALFAAYVGALISAPKLDARWILGAIALVQLIFLLAPPLEYTDVFNYINYARLGVVHHLDPYTTLPVNGPHGDPAYAISNWHYLRSPYGPLFTLLTYALVPLGVAGDLWALKVIVGLCSIVLLALVWRLAKLLGRSPQLAVALVGLNPIVLVWGLGGEHNDFMMMAPVFGAIYLVVAPRLRGQEPPARIASPAGLLASPDLAAGVLLVVALGIKSSAAIFMPLGLALARSRRQALAGMMGAALVLIAASLLSFGPHLGGLRAQSTLVSPEGLPNLLGIGIGLGGAGDAMRGVLTAVAALVILAAAARAWRHPSKAMVLGCVTALALILTLGWSAPWYVLWALPFAALVVSNRWRWVVLAYTLYALIASSPSLAAIENGLHFHPRRGRLGREEVANFDHLGDH